MMWLVLILLLTASALVSAAETALFSLPVKTLREFEALGGLQRRAARLMRRPREVLMTVLMANTATNVGIYAVSYVAIVEIGHTHPTVAAAASLAVLLSVIVLGEIIPKGVALANARLIAPVSAALLWGIQVILNPVLWLLSTFLVNPITRLFSPAQPMPATVTMEELRLLVEHSARHGHIDSTENEMLQAIVGLPDTSVRDIMTPRVDIEWVSVHAPPEQIQRTVTVSKKRNFPACGKDLDDIKGIIYSRDALLAPQTPVRSLVRPVEFVPEQINLGQLMRHFREQKSHLAIVVDEYGGTAGLVTSEDAVEWIVGDLPDEDEGVRAPPTERIDGNTYRVAGDLSVREWADRFGVQEVEGRIDTVAGLILARLGRLPQVGDRIRLRNLTLTVETMDRRRIDRVLLHLDSALPETTGAGI